MLTEKQARHIERFGETPESLADRLFGKQPIYKIINLKRLVNHPHMWSFNLSMGGFIINGFTYVEGNPCVLGGIHKRPSIMVPTYGPKKKRLVRAYGIQWKRMSAKVQELIKEMEVK